MSASQDSTSEEGLTKTKAPSSDQAAPDGGFVRQKWTRFAWAGFAAAFLAFILVGTVPARIWRLGSLHIDSKSIARTWIVQLDHLPDVRFQWLVQASFVVSMLLFVIGVVVAFRLLLAQDEGIDPDRAKRA
jgi:hypothetical protein